MKILPAFIMITALLFAPVSAADTSNWIAIAAPSGIAFTIPPYWAWEVVDSHSVAIRNEQSDAVLLISHAPLDGNEDEVCSDPVKEKVRERLSDLQVRGVETLVCDPPVISASGKTRAGMIINLTEKQVNNHSYEWVGEYADDEAFLKYAETIRMIMGGTEFPGVSSDIAV